MKVSFVKLLRYKKRNENISLDEKRIEGIISYTVIEDERGLFFYMETIQLYFEQVKDLGFIGSVFAMFFYGVLAGFTPCVYPVLPLTMGYIGNASDGNRRRSVLLSFVLVFSMASVFAIMGVIFTAIGMRMGEIWANGYAVFAIAWFFLLMGLMMMDAISVPHPKFLSRIQEASSGERKGVAGAIVVGCVSGLVVGPCVAPVLGVALAMLATTFKEATGWEYVMGCLSGGVQLFAFGLGHGILILLCGIFAGLLSKLPRSGNWMVTLKKSFAMMVIAGAVFLFIHIGQATNFPQLADLLASLESHACSGEGCDCKKDTQHSATPTSFGGDEFLD